MKLEIWQNFRSFHWKDVKLTLGRWENVDQSANFFLDSYDNLSVMELHSFLSYVYLRYRKIYS